MTDRQLIEQIKHTAASPAFVGSVAKQREFRRQLVLAQGAALRACGHTEIAERYEATALKEVELVSHCGTCGLELIGNDECARCGAPEIPEYDTASEGDEA